MKTSAPLRASCRPPRSRWGLVRAASSACAGLRLSSPAQRMPSLSLTTTSTAPPASSSVTIAEPAAPPPDTTIRTSAIFFSTQRRALVSAASTTIAVPCWSSWKTGMSRLAAQPALDLEAARRRDVLEVDAAEPGRDHLDGLHDLVGVLGRQADRPGVDVGEPLEQRRLALHHRQRRARADVAQAEHGRAVGDDGDGVALDREAAYVVGVGRQRQADATHARRVGHRQVVAGPQRDLRPDLDLAADVEQEGAVADLVDLDARHHADRGDELLGVVGVGGRAGHVDDEAVVARVGDVDAGDDAAGGGDGGGDGSDDSVVGRGVQSHRDGVRRRGGRHAPHPSRAARTTRGRGAGGPAPPRAAPSATTWAPPITADQGRDLDVVQPAGEDAADQRRHGLERRERAVRRAQTADRHEVGDQRLDRGVLHAGRGAPQEHPADRDRRRGR